MVSRSSRPQSPETVTFARSCANTHGDAHFGRGEPPARLQRHVEFSAWYLASLIERFDGSLPLAIASYNGGPQRGLHAPAPLNLRSIPARSFAQLRQLAARGDARRCDRAFQLIAGGCGKFTPGGARSMPLNPNLNTKRTHTEPMTVVVVVPAALVTRLAALVATALLATVWILAR